VIGIAVLIAVRVRSARCQPATLLLPILNQAENGEADQGKGQGDGQKRAFHASAACGDSVPLVGWRTVLYHDGHPYSRAVRGGGLPILPRDRRHWVARIVGCGPAANHGRLMSAAI
jgi:hypothetical protein